MATEALRKATGLFAAHGAHKGAVLLFSFAVGHRTGAEGVGVMASVLALCWVGNTVVGMGLPDRALFQGALVADSTVERRLHGLYLWFTGLLHLGLFWVAGRLGDTVDPQLVRFAQGLVLGAATHAASAVGLSWLRGAARARAETVGYLAASTVLVGGVVAGFPLGLVWTGAGVVLCSVALIGLGRAASAPAMPRGADIALGLRSGLPYLVFGLGAWLLGNGDILLARVGFEPGAVGALQVGAMVPRSAALLPWLVGTLCLREAHDRWDQGRAPRWRWWCGIGLGLGVLTALLTFLLTPLLARGHGMAVASVHRPMVMAMLCTPALFMAVILMPFAAAWNLRRTLVALGAGVGAGLMVGGLVLHQLEVAGCLVALGVAQWVALVGLVWVLAGVGRNTRGEE